MAWHQSDVAAYAGFHTQAQQRIADKQTRLLASRKAGAGVQRSAATDPGEESHIRLLLAGYTGFVWVHADSFLRCVASPFHSFVTTYDCVVNAAILKAQRLFLPRRRRCSPRLLLSQSLHMSALCTWPVFGGAEPDACLDISTRISGVLFDPVLLSFFFPRCFEFYRLGHLVGSIYPLHTLPCILSA